MAAITSAISSIANKTLSAAVTGKVMSMAARKSADVTRQKMASRVAISSYHLPATNMNPYFIQYQHRLYLTPGPFTGDSYQHSVKPGMVLAHFTSLLNIPGKNDQIACAVQETDPAKGVCIRDFNDKNDYPYYPYLCDETVVINRRSYHFTGDTDFISLDAPETQSAASAAPSDGNPANEYKLNLNILSFVPHIMDNVRGSKIGVLPGGTVYAIDEIDPSEAIIIHSSSLWLTATKQYGYTGKTIEDVWREKSGVSDAVLY